MPDEITLGELSHRTGEPEARLIEWRSLGLIGSDSDAFVLADAERVKLMQMCLRRGITAEAVARKNNEIGILERYVAMMFPEGPTEMYSVPEAAEMLGLDLDLLRRVTVAAGFPEPRDMISKQDMEGLRVFKGLVDAGFPADALVEGTSVLVDSLGRVAEMESRIFHIYIHERMKQAGIGGLELAEATRVIGQSAEPLVEPLVLYFHRLGWQRAVREDLVDHMAEEAGLLPTAELPGEMTRAVTFIDLSSFTPLTAAMGDATAAQVLDRFSELVRESVVRWEGRIVKQIGDAFMLVFQEPRAALACVLEVESRTAAEPQFPAARAGIHWGTVLYRSGDYVGSNVNIASRLCTDAGRHQILVTDEVRKEARDLPDIEFVRLGKRKLKGLAENIVLFEARSSATTAPEKLIDPVCGMELGAAEIAASLTLDGVERAFCSDDCLRKFVVAPEQYT